MRVSLILENSHIFNQMNDLTNISFDGLFSVNDIYCLSHTNLNDVRNEFGKLLDKDLIFMMNDEIHPNMEPYNERWGLCTLSIHPNQIYDVLEIYDDYYRLLNDGNEPVLFHKDNFKIVDIKKNNNWIKEIDNENVIYFTLSQWKDFFFEDYFEGKKDSYNQFINDIKDAFPYTYFDRYLSEFNEEHTLETIYSDVIQDLVYDLSISSYWRKILFDSNFNKQLVVDEFNSQDLISCSDQIIKYRMQFYVSKIEYVEEKDHCMEDGLVILKFESRWNPNIKWYSYNNPNVI